MPILILGEDVTHTAPRVALGLRQAVRNKAHQLAEQAGLPKWQDAAVRNSRPRSALTNDYCVATGYPSR